MGLCSSLYNLLLDQDTREVREREERIAKLYRAVNQRDLECLVALTEINTLLELTLCSRSTSRYQYNQDVLRSYENRYIVPILDHWHFRPVFREQIDRYTAVMRRAQDQHGQSDESCHGAR